VFFAKQDQFKKLHFEPLLDLFFIPSSLVHGTKSEKLLIRVSLAIDDLTSNKARAMSDTPLFEKIKSMMPKLVHLVYVAHYANERLSFDALSL
jgi:hypothetical protein